MTRVDRPKKDTTVAIRFVSEDLERVDRARGKLTRSEFIRRAVELVSWACLKEQKR